MFHYRFTKNDLDKLLDSMIQLSDINPEMSLEDVVSKVCDDIPVTGYTSADICESLLYIIDNDTIFEIKDGVLQHCFISDIKEVQIPSNITSIGDNAFYECNNLTSITIPDGVISIGDGAFLGCTSLKNITIPENVNSIGNHTFRKCTNLTEINIPNNVKSIGEYAFYRCSNLTSLTIGEGVRSIGDNAFTRCDKLLSINYEGTIEQWKSISKSPYWNYRIDTYIIHCTDGDIFL